MLFSLFCQRSSLFFFLPVPLPFLVISRFSFPSPPPSPSLPARYRGAICHPSPFSLCREGEKTHPHPAQRLRGRRTWLRKDVPFSPPGCSEMEEEGGGRARARAANPICRGEELALSATSSLLGGGKRSCKSRGLRLVVELGRGRKDGSFHLMHDAVQCILN